MSQPTEQVYRLVDPLSVVEIRRLGWLRSKIDAIEFLAAHDDDAEAEVDFAFARRLAFAHYLYVTGRLNEGRPV